MKKKLLQKGKRALAWLLTVSMFLGSESMNMAVLAQDDIVEVSDYEMGTAAVDEQGDVIVEGSAVSASGLEIIPEIESTELSSDSVDLGEVEVLEGSGTENQSQPESGSESENKSEPESEFQLQSESEEENDNEPELITIEETELPEALKEEFFITEESIQTQLYAMASEAVPGSLQEKINNAGESGVNLIVLDKDYTETVVIPAGKVIELDLNGCTLSPDTSIRTGSSDMNTISVYGTLSICDSDENGKGEIANTEAAANVRGIAVMYGGSVTFNSGNVTGFSTDTRGAGVAVEKNGSFTMNGGTIAGNSTGIDGGGIYAYDGSGLKVNGGSITGNKADGDGGGIYAYDGSGLKVNSGSITGNKADGDGGGICVNVCTGDGLSFDSESLTIADNEAEANGGGVCMEGSVPQVHIGAGAYTGNKAGAYGGAFCFSQAVVSCSITGAIKSNSAVYGGGINIAAGSKVTVSDGAEIMYNTAVYSGGGLRQVGASGVTSKFTMTGGSIGENKLECISYKYTCGAGIHLTESIEAIFRGSARIHGNTGAVFGGGINIGGNSVVKLEGNCVIDNNSTGGGYGGHGGGIYQDGGKLTMNGGTVQNNTTLILSSNGGGINSRAVFTMNGGRITGNSCTNRGGGVFCTKMFYMNGGEISGNSSNVGGGVCIDGSGGEMTAGEISGNSAESDGGGIYVTGTLNMSGGRISDNSTGKSGGGVFGSTKLSGDAVIENNQANYYGGGIYGSLTISGGTISGNSSNVGGGGIALNGSAVISGGAITNNTAYTYGGGIYTEGANQTLTLKGNGLISGNSAGSDGGGCYLKRGTMKMEGGTVTGNTAKYGGGIFMCSDTDLLNVTGGLIYDNKAGASNLGNDIRLGALEGTDTTAPKAYLIKASDMIIDENREGVCWYNEDTNTEESEAIEITDEGRTAVCRYTFMYSESGMAAAIGTIQYETVQEAVNALEGNASGKVITMLRNSKESVVIPENKNTKIVLDLAGYTLSGNGGCVIEAGKGTALTICDSSEAGTGMITGGVGKSIPGKTESETYGGGLYIVSAD